MHGPNGFYREFIGNGNNPLIKVACNYEKTGKNTGKLSGNLVVEVVNNDTKTYNINIVDNGYNAATQTKIIAPGSKASIILDLAKNHQWYDFSVKVKGNDTFEERFAGHVENGTITKTDPVMGDMV